MNRTRIKALALTRDGHVVAMFTASNQGYPVLQWIDPSAPDIVYKELNLMNTTTNMGPFDLTVMPSGDIAITDFSYSRVLIVDADGILLKKFTGLLMPKFIDKDANNKLVITDSGNNRICIYDTVSNQKSFILNDGQLDQPKGVAIVGNSIVVGQANGMVKVFPYTL